MIKKTGLGAPVTPPQVDGDAGVRGPAGTKATGPRFSATAQTMGATAPATTGSAAATDPVARAVCDIARDVRAGRLSDPKARVDALVTKLVESELGGRVDARALKARIAEVRLALADNPEFTRRVHALIEAEASVEG